jgi:hypothetical protein
MQTIGALGHLEAQPDRRWGAIVSVPGGHEQPDLKAYDVSTVSPVVANTEDG